MKPESIAQLVPDLADVMTNSETLERELIQLERNPQTGRIDHPPRGSKDVADAVCGAVYAAARSRAIRTLTESYTEDGSRAERRRSNRPRSNRPRRP